MFFANLPEMTLPDLRTVGVTEPDCDCMPFLLEGKTKRRNTGFLPI